MKGREESRCSPGRDPKVPEDKDSEGMGNAVIAAPSVIHREGKGMTALAADITEKEFVETCVDGFVSLAASMLRGRHRLGLLSMSKAGSADVFVADLKL